MAIRLTEKEVHNACLEISSQGERPTSLALLNKLGRGSLTTITKYLNSWNETEDAQSLNTELLPSVVELPEDLSLNGQELTKKIWAMAKGLADGELELQREALKQAETANQAKVEEAFQFSEAQTEKIDFLEESLKSSQQALESKIQDYSECVIKLNEAEKINVGIAKDNESLSKEASVLQARILELEALDKSHHKEKSALEKNHVKVTKERDSKINSLDLNVHKLQSSLDVSVKTNNQIKADIKKKTADLSVSVIAYEKLNVHYETLSSEFDLTRKELKSVQKKASDAEKLVSNLEGKLEVYNLLGTKQGLN